MPRTCAMPPWCGAAGAGACLGFLRFNTNPARVIMGDTGSMFIGGLFVGGRS